MARIVQLNALKGGINRLRIKGGPDASSLYDLINGFVTIDGSVQSRPGSTGDVTLPSGTKGLCAFDGGMVVFSHQPKTISNARYTCEVLVNPNDSSQAIAEIHFSGPFMGFLYVVAEFDNGDVFHYWLQESGTWAVSTMYRIGDTILPTIRNGFRYQPLAGDMPPAWAPNVQRAIGDVVQPTVYTGWKYTVTGVAGDNPVSGPTEPAWIGADGALTYEDINNTPASTTPPPTKPPVDPRYANNPFSAITIDVSGAPK